MMGVKLEKPSEVYLSVVVTSRNDDHGGELLKRMQIFVNSFVEQCQINNLNAELIIVEWNPPQDRPRFINALTWPEKMGPCQIRIIEILRKFIAHMLIQTDSAFFR